MVANMDVPFGIRQTNFKIAQNPKDQTCIHVSVSVEYHSKGQYIAQNAWTRAYKLQHIYYMYIRAVSNCAYVKRNIMNSH
jgi:hypothetical protein